MAGGKQANLDFQKVKTSAILHNQIARQPRLTPSGRIEGGGAQADNSSHRKVNSVYLHQQQLNPSQAKQLAVGGGERDYQSQQAL